MRRDVLRASALALFVAGVVCIAYGRTSAAAWRVPIDYYGDSWPALALLKVAAEGHLAPLWHVVVPGELGAPFDADWNGYLRQHKLQYLLAGGLVRVVGLMPAANLLVPLAAALAASSFYFVCRYFRARPEWALAGGTAFALSPYFFYRGLSHLALSFYWPLPLAVLVVTWAFGRHGLVLRSRRFAAAVAIVLATGVHNIYYAGLLAQFLALAALARALRARRLAAAVPPLVLLVLLLASVVVDNANVVIAAWSGAPTSAMDRPYGNLERFALKPIELLLPISHPGLAPWASLGAVYFRSALYRGEMGAAYLGLAGVLGLVCLSGLAAASYLRRPKGFVPASFMAVCFTLAGSVVGGLNGVLGTLGFVWFRATNRYSVWILTLVLLWGVLAISRSALARRRRLSVLAATVAIVVTLADQVPPRVRADAIRELGARVASDATFVRSIEATLPPGAMLFQLPVVDFPEGPRVNHATDYEHLRPYLHSRRLRFSYGSDKGRARDAWQHRTESLEPEELANALERIGFAGLLVNRKGYQDGAQSLRERLAASGRLEAWESPDGDFLFVRLRPAVDPVPPDVAVPEVPRRRGRGFVTAAGTVLLLAAIALAALLSGRLFIGAFGGDLYRRFDPAGAAAALAAGTALLTLLSVALSGVGFPTRDLPLLIAALHLAPTAICARRRRLDVLRPRGAPLEWVTLAVPIALTATLALLPVTKDGGFSFGNDTYTYSAFSEWLQTHGYSETCRFEAQSPVTGIPALYQSQGYDLGIAHWLALVQAVVRPATVLVVYPSTSAFGLVLLTAALWLAARQLLRLGNAGAGVTALVFAAVPHALYWGHHNGFMQQGYALPLVVFGLVLLARVQPPARWRPSTAALLALPFAFLLSVYLPLLPVLGLAGAVALVPAVLRARRRGSLRRLAWFVVAVGGGIALYAARDLVGALSPLHRFATSVAGGHIPWDAADFFQFAFGARVLAPGWANVEVAPWSALNRALTPLYGGLALAGLVPRRATAAHAAAGGGRGAHRPGGGVLRARREGPLERKGRSHLEPVQARAVGLAVRADARRTRRPAALPLAPAGCASPLWRSRSRSPSARSASTGRGAPASARRCATSCPAPGSGSSKT